MGSTCRPLALSLVAALGVWFAPAALAAEPAPPEDPAPPAVDTPPAADAPPAADPPPAADVPAAPVVDAALMLRQNRAKELRLRGQEHARAGRIAEAVDALREALDAYPAYPLAHNELGTLFVKQGDLARAEASFNQALALAPDFVAARYNLAELHRMLARPDDALAGYRIVIEEEPDNAAAYYALAALFHGRDQQAESLWAMQRFLETAIPTAPRVATIRDRADGLLKGGVSPQAPEWDVAEAPAAAASDPDSPVVEVARRPGEPPPLPPHDGDREFYTQRYLDALSKYQAALEASPDDVVLRYKIGATYAVMNDLRSAIRIWREALLLAPERELIVHHIGLAHQQLAGTGGAAAADQGIARAQKLLLAGRAAEAIAALAGQPGPEAAAVRAEAYLSVGHLGRARASFEEVLAATPDDRAAVGGLGEVLLRLGVKAPGEAAMRTWLGDRPAHPETFLVLRASDLATRLAAGDDGWDEE